MSKPSFEDKSWDDYSFWQTCYYYSWDATYRNTLQNAILAAFESAEKDLAELRKINQKNPAAGLIQKWGTTVDSYARSISCDEGEKVNTALTELAKAIHEQWVSDELLLKSGKKKLKQPTVTVPKETTPTTQTAPVTTTKVKPPKTTKPKVTEDDSLNLLLNSSFGQSGHSKQTAKTPTNTVKKKAASSGPTKEEIWGYSLKEMEDDCADTIDFGEHDAAASVLYALNIHGQSGIQERPRKCEGTNNETRIIYVGSRTFWTVGLSHERRRKAGTYVAYERMGKRQFTFVSGKRRPTDPLY